MYGKYVNYHGIRVWVNGIPTLSEKEWQRRAKIIIKLKMKEK